MTPKCKPLNIVLQEKMHILCIKVKNIYLRTVFVQLYNLTFFLRVFCFTIFLDLIITEDIPPQRINKSVAGTPLYCPP